MQLKCIVYPFKHQLSADCVNPALYCSTLLATGIGMIPLIGDIIMAVRACLYLKETCNAFPQTFKPNSRNAMLFEEFLVERVRL